MGRILLLFVFFAAAFVKLSAHHQPGTDWELSGNKDVTTIYLVRHAEKDTRNPTDQDPGLTSAGVKRAEDLMVYLKDESIDAFFSTPYKRTQQTLTPLLKGRPIQFYDAHDFTALRTRILSEFAGKTILIVGHSNTILPLIEAFGAKKPIDQISDNQYDAIFKLKISAKGKAKVQMQKFGAISA